MAEYKNKIRSFISNFVGARTAAGDEEDIFALGFVNSLFAMQLITWIEKEFKVQVEDDELDLKNFNSVDAIARFTARKLTLQAA